tara:strand:+ start:435 stop:719 length:285 start_codon:yes stop_codon:yes gene_type:complete
MQDKKKDNVVGIGHNNNVSKEQYAKIVNKLHRMLKYSQQEINRVERFLDQAFTKYPFRIHINQSSKSLKYTKLELREKILQVVMINMQRNILKI